MRDVAGRLRDVENQGLERLLLGVGRQVRAEVDALTVELMAGVADRGRKFALGHVTLEGNDRFHRGERLGTRHLRGQIAGDEFSGRGVTAAGLDDAVDIEGLPEVALTITDPPLGQLDLGESLVQG